MAGTRAAPFGRLCQPQRLAHACPAIWQADPCLDTPFTSNADPADPVKPGRTGVRHFFVDATGKFRFELRRPATATSTPIGEQRDMQP